MTVIGIASASCLLIIGQLVYSGANRDPFATEIENLRQFVRRDAQLNQALLEAWLLTPHYDYLNASVASIDEADARLGVPPSSDTAAADTVLRRQLHEALADKEDRIERFKTRQAVLRNSEQYFPLATATLLSELDSPQAAPLATAIVKMRGAMLSFHSEPATLVRLRRSIDAVAALAPLAPKDERALLAHALLHAHNIMTLVPEVMTQVETGLALPTTVLAEQLLQHYDDHLQYRVRVARTERSFFSAAAVALLALIGLISLRLWHSRAALKNALGQLEVEQQRVSDHNTTLEAQVQQRTVELALRNWELETNVRLLSNTQEQLAVAGRMATVGTMAAGVAHEINNPLAFVTSNTHYVVEELDRLSAWAHSEKTVLPIDLDDVLVALKDVELGSKRVIEIVKGLKSFSHMDKRVTQPIDIRKVLQFALTMAANPIGQKANLVRALGDVPAVMANEAELGQVFLNLLVNAAQAFGDDQPRGTIHVTTFERPDGKVCIEIRDSGCGMSAAVQGRIFDPFFTTKPVGTGTGLGLSICHGIIKAYGGDIVVESVAGEGSTFRVVLPPAEDGLVVAAARVPGQHPLAVRSRILVIDDDCRVGQALGRTLGTEHDVAVTRGAEEALDLIEDGARFDLIICDLMMPGMSGADFEEALVARHPAQARAVVYLSGGAMTPRTREFATAVEDRFFAKPLAPEALRALVERFCPPSP